MSCLIPEYSAESYNHAIAKLFTPFSASTFWHTLWKHHLLTAKKG